MRGFRCLFNLSSLSRRERKALCPKPLKRSLLNRWMLCNLMFQSSKDRGHEGINRLLMRRCRTFCAVQTLKKNTHSIEITSSYTVKSKLNCCIKHQRVFQCFDSDSNECVTYYVSICQWMNPVGPLTVV